MIKKYAPFLESVVEHEFMSFKEVLKECQEYYNENGSPGFEGSYSLSAKLYRDHLMDPERDFELVNKYMTENGFPLEMVKNLVKNLQFSRKIYSNTAISKCAPTDYYLYKITNGEFPLQGYEWDIREDSRWNVSGGTDELLIRYLYGWHKSKYGKIIIEQNMGTVKNFIMKTFNNVQNNIIYQLSVEMGLNVEAIKNNNLHQEGDELRSPIDGFMYSTELKDCFFDETSDMYIDCVELLNIFNRSAKREHIDISYYNQQQFDKLVIEICKDMGFESRVVTEGDVKIKFV